MLLTFLYVSLGWIWFAYYRPPKDALMAFAKLFGDGMMRRLRRRNVYKNPDLMGDSGRSLGSLYPCHTANSHPEADPLRYGHTRAFPHQ